MATLVLDATGEECPVPLEMASEKIESMAAGDTLLVRSTDPVSPIDFEAWCERQPHEFLGAVQVGDIWEIGIACRSGFSRDGRG